MKTFGQIAFTPAVEALQERDGSRGPYARMKAAPAPAGLGEEELRFLDATDSFFVATVSETGWPYVQHRGGPPGFLRAVDGSTLAFADFRGNRQHVSEGNVAVNDRASLLVMDFAERRRLKLLGRLRFEPAAAADPALARAVALPGYRARVERIAVFAVEAFDWNCPQHIPRRYSEEEVAALLRPVTSA